MHERQAAELARREAERERIHRLHEEEERQRLAEKKEQRLARDNQEGGRGGLRTGGFEPCTSWFAFY